MGQSNLFGILRRSQAKTGDRRRLDAERRAGLQPRGGYWYVVDGLGHLYLKPARDKPDGPARPVCGVVPTEGAREMNVTSGDAVCPTCETYLYEVCLPAYC